ncbi:MAG: hypothetical protein ABI995_06205 [Acidobacteriota bacterium]
MKIQNHTLAKVLRVTYLVAGISLMPAVANAAPHWSTSYGPTQMIYSNPGGRIIDFALQAAKYRASRTLIQFAGQCDSSCTLFLGLPRSQTCISPGASFHLHAPVASNERASHKAKLYMLRKYPGWVRSFIAMRGGLTRNLITIDYSAASRFIPSCSGMVASR